MNKKSHKTAIKVIALLVFLWHWNNFVLQTPTITMGSIIFMIYVFVLARSKVGKDKFYEGQEPQITNIELEVQVAVVLKKLFI